jgi:hypothetical protein
VALLAIIRKTRNPNYGYKQNMKVRKKLFILYIVGYFLDPDMQSSILKKEFK